MVFTQLMYLMYSKRTSSGHVTPQSDSQTIIKNPETPSQSRHHQYSIKTCFISIFFSKAYYGGPAYLNSRASINSTRPESFRVGSTGFSACDSLLAPLVAPKEASADIPLPMITRTCSKIQAMKTTRISSGAWLTVCAFGDMMLLCNICTTLLHFGVTKFSPGLVCPSHLLRRLPLTRSQTIRMTRFGLLRHTS
jgi:hypothetical protein